MEGTNVPTSRGRTRLAGAALVVLQLLALAAPAAAAPIEVTRDRVDGGTFFTWDAETGTFPPDGDYGSSIVIRRGDPVRFFADAKPVEGAPPGERLLGRLTLRLKGAKAVRYDGTFTFVVKWDGVVYHRARQVASFTLRPAPGKRKRILRFPFDLAESGMYGVTGRFRATAP